MKIELELFWSTSSQAFVGSAGKMKKLNENGPKIVVENFSKILAPGKSMDRKWIKKRFTHKLAQWNISAKTLSGSKIYSHVLNLYLGLVTEFFVICEI